jgi:hypothetical protein
MRLIKREVKEETLSTRSGTQRKSYLKLFQYIQNVTQLNGYQLYNVVYTISPSEN